MTSPPMPLVAGDAHGFGPGQVVGVRTSFHRCPAPPAASVKRRTKDKTPCA